ncbi:hypothetical protein [Actinomadura rubrisoli]|uniref:Uncharacterized protein n=1 Tax=Actinomadura rubrisoli TaxID=2530368 RepID=A0A4R5CFL6_9ACTN|nr:hypothetical protein [Actinomadura rubrisoli]TDD97200.1 hypothetical protein E1298_01825 [Actinomadura rubrisoli]
MSEQTSESGKRVAKAVEMYKAMTEMRNTDSAAAKSMGMELGKFLDGFTSSEGKEFFAATRELETSTINEKAED